MTGAEGYIASIEARADRDLRVLQGGKEKSLTVSKAGNETLRLYEEGPKYPPVVVTTGGLLSASFPPREKLLQPWLTTQSLTMIYAMRGTGKTHVALGIGYALATAGEFLGWCAPVAVPVLYVDGEMPGSDLQARVRRIVEGHGGKQPDLLRFMTPDQQPDGIMPNLYQPEGRDALNAALGEARVVIVDNLSCLVRGGKENEGESWQPVAEWALRMRSSGRSVVFIHHAGKGGQQRGTSKREDLLDTVIALRRPADYEPDQGARFEVHFEKARALYGQDVSPIEAALETLPGGMQAWSMRPVSETSEALILEYLQLGMGSADIIAETGCSRATFFRKKKELVESGQFKPKAGRGKSQSLTVSRLGNETVRLSPAEAYRRAKEGE
jgi:hypothetical protein